MLLSFVSLPPPPSPLSSTTTRATAYLHNPIASLLLVTAPRQTKPVAASTSEETHETPLLLKRISGLYPSCSENFHVSCSLLIKSAATVRNVADITSS